MHVVTEVRTSLVVDLGIAPPRLYV
jgi:hypothetical protein